MITTSFILLFSFSTLVLFLATGLRCTDVASHSILTQNISGTLCLATVVYYRCKVNLDVTHLVIHGKESLLPGCPFLDTFAYDVISDDSVAEDRRRKRTKIKIRNMLIFEDK